MSSTELSFSIVLYNNNPQEIKTLLQCISETTLSYQIFIVDNSSDTSLSSIVKKYPHTTYEHAKENIGYGRGHNRAIQQVVSFSKYHIILNPDISFTKGTIETIYAFMESQEDVGQVMPKILYEDGGVQRLCKLLPTPTDLILRRFIKTMGIDFKLDYELDCFDYESVFEFPSLSGCFMFLRSDKLKLIGGFDPRFFLYLEDFDLTRRMHKIAKTLYFPHASATHRFDKASYNNPQMLKLHIASAVKYFNKWGWFRDKERDSINKETLKKLSTYYTKHQSI